MKRVLSFLLTLAISGSFCVPVFAVNKEDVQIEETYYEDKKLVTTFEEEKVTMERFSAETGELEVSVEWERGTDYIRVEQGGSEKTILINGSIGENENGILRAPSLTKSTEMGYGYSVSYGSRNSWSLSCPEYVDGGDTVYSFMCDERESYADRLDSFREDVDNIAALEEKIAARTSTQILNAALAAAFVATGTPAGFTFAFTAWFADRNYSVQIQDFAADMGIYQSDAYDQYWRIQREWSDLARRSPELSIAI